MSRRWKVPLRGTLEGAKMRLQMALETDSKTGCWCWKWPITKSKIKNNLNYPHIRVLSRKVTAHRFAYEIHKGKIPHGMVVRHTCDNPICCNPDHLIIGTQAQNVADSVIRNRYAHGSAHPLAKTNEEDVRAMRMEYQRGKYRHGIMAMAKKYKISFRLAHGILNGQRWKHVT